MNHEKIINHYDSVDPAKKVAFSKEKLFNSFLKKMVKNEYRNSSILDIGCGAGYFLKKAQGVGFDPYGIEISAALSKEANSILKGNQVFAGKLGQAAINDCSIDIITIWDTLFHCVNPYDELKECHRILKRGGTIAIRVRNVSFQKAIRMVYKRFYLIASKLNIKDPSVFHSYCFSRKSIEILLSRLGFRQVSIVNSPLSTGDPYGYSDLADFTKIAKNAASLLQKIFFKVSDGRWIIGPSLLVMAKK